MEVPRTFLVIRVRLYSPSPTLNLVCLTFVVSFATIALEVSFAIGTLFHYWNTIAGGETNHSNISSNVSFLTGVRIDNCYFFFIVFKPREGWGREIPAAPASYCTRASACVFPIALSGSEFESGSLDSGGDRAHKDRR